MDKRRISLAADYIIRKSVENRSSHYVGEVVGDILVVLEVLCFIDSVVVFCDFLRLRILGQSEKILGQNYIKVFRDLCDLKKCYFVKNNIK